MSAPARALQCALVGAGVWGRNLARVVANHPDAALTAVVDPDPVARTTACENSVGAMGFRSLDEALAARRIDAVIIASPDDTHYALARAALLAGTHLLVEKPLATSARDANDVAALASRTHAIAMIGHLMLYHPAVQRMLALVREGAIGKPLYLTSKRLSPSTTRSDGPALWALGPHDFSVVHALDPAPLAAIYAHETARDERGVAHAALVQARLTSGFGAHVDLSRIHPGKERRMAVVGDEGALVFDDMQPSRKLRHLRVRSRAEGVVRSFDDLLRDGGTQGNDVDVAAREPLAEELDHFVRAVRGEVAVRTPFEDGATVVTWLERAASTDTALSVGMTTRP